MRRTLHGVGRKMLPNVAITCHKTHAANCPPGQWRAFNSPGEEPCQAPGQPRVSFLPMDNQGDATCEPSTRGCTSSDLPPSETQTSTGGPSNPRQSLWHIHSSSPAPMAGREIRVHAGKAGSPWISEIWSVPRLGNRAVKPGNLPGPGFRPRAGSLPSDMQRRDRIWARAPQVACRQACGATNPTHQVRQTCRGGSAEALKRRHQGVRQGRCPVAGSVNWLLSSSVTPEIRELCIALLLVAAAHAEIRRQGRRTIIGSRSTREVLT